MSDKFNAATEVDKLHCLAQNLIKDTIHAKQMPYRWFGGREAGARIDRENSALVDELVSIWSDPDKLAAVRDEIDKRHLEVFPNSGMENLFLTNGEFSSMRFTGSFYLNGDGCISARERNDTLTVSVYDDCSLLANFIGMDPTRQTNVLLRKNVFDTGGDIRTQARPNVLDVGSNALTQWKLTGDK